VGRLLLAFSILVWAMPAVAQPARPNPARALFESDWVLMNWALKLFDRDHDMMLSDAEAQAAAGEFRELADTNRDGRVTPEEYSAARAAILAQG
jgi:hypothetical protein